MPVVSWLGLLTICLAAETCYEGPSGASLTDGRAGGHNIQVGARMSLIKFFFLFLFL